MSLPDRLTRVCTHLVALSLNADIVVIIVLAQNVVRAVGMHASSCSCIRWSLRPSQCTQSYLLLLTHSLLV